MRHQAVLPMLATVRDAIFGWLTSSNRDLQNLISNHMRISTKITWQLNYHKSSC